MNKKLLIVLFVLLISAVSFARSFLGLTGIIPWHYGYSDVFNEDRIDVDSAKKIPYLEQPIEYPVITGFFIYLMWHFGKTIFGYAILTWSFLTLFAIITALVLYQLADLLNIGRDNLYPFFIFAPSLALFEIYNWDIIAVMLTVTSVYFFYKNQYSLSAFFLSLGFNAKLFPAVLLPVMLSKTNLRQAIKMISIFLLTFLALNIYFIAGNFGVWKATYMFHGLREPNIDSLWSLSRLGTGAINVLSAILFLASYFILMYNHKRYGFIDLSFASILLFLLFNKIFSPQYLLWILPFFVLSGHISKKKFYSLEVANIIVFFSTSYWILASKDQVFLAISNTSVIIRSIILAYILLTLLKIKNIYKYNLPSINFHI